MLLNVTDGVTFLGKFKSRSNPYNVASTMSLIERLVSITSFETKDISIATLYPTDYLCWPMIWAFHLISKYIHADQSVVLVGVAKQLGPTVISLFQKDAVTQKQVNIFAKPMAKSLVEREYESDYPT